MSATVEVCWTYALVKTSVSGAIIKMEQDLEEYEVGGGGEGGGTMVMNCP
jgi:hypothetical protein